MLPATRSSHSRLVLFCLLLVLAGCTGSLRAKDAIAAPRQAAQTFYDTLLPLRIQGLPDEAQQAALDPLLTPELRAALHAARAWQLAEIERMRIEEPTDKPPYVDGNLFGSLYEGMHDARVAKVDIDPEDPDRAHALIDLRFNDRGEVIAWQDRLQLRRIEGQWLADDIENLGDWAFQAGGSSLRESLRLE